ncbi:MAG: type II toxin-antitoxin system Phd/YefM family antitoxin [Verrucomicrobiota bacterium]
MTVTTISSREFNQDVSRAKRAADAGPVFVTDRGRPAYVLLQYEAYQRLAGPPKSLLDAVAMPGSDDIVFDPPRMGAGVFQVPDLS